MTTGAGNPEGTAFSAVGIIDDPSTQTPFPMEGQGEGNPAGQDQGTGAKPEQTPPSQEQPVTATQLDAAVRGITNQVNSLVRQVQSLANKGVEIPAELREGLEAAKETRQELQTIRVSGMSAEEKATYFEAENKRLQERSTKTQQAATTKATEQPPQGQTLSAEALQAIVDGQWPGKLGAMQQYATEVLGLTWDPKMVAELEKLPIDTFTNGYVAWDKWEPEARRYLHSVQKQTRQQEETPAGGAGAALGSGRRPASEGASDSPDFFTTDDAEFATRMVRAGRR